MFITQIFCNGAHRERKLTSTHAPLQIGGEVLYLKTQLALRYETFFNSKSA